MATKKPAKKAAKKKKR